MATDADHTREILAPSFSRRSQLVRRLKLINCEPRPSQLRPSASSLFVIADLFLTGILTASRFPLTASPSLPVKVSSEVLQTHLLERPQAIQPRRGDSTSGAIVLRILVDAHGFIVEAAPVTGNSTSGQRLPQCCGNGGSIPSELSQTDTSSRPTEGQMRSEWRTGDQLVEPTKAVLGQRRRTQAHPFELT